MSAANIETIIESLGQLYVERYSEQVPFRFGLAELNKWGNHSGPNYFWLPIASNVKSATSNSPGIYGKTLNSPSFDKHERFAVVIHAADRGDAELLHRRLIATLVACPGQIDVGSYEWETEREDVQALNVNGATITQEVTIVTEVQDLLSERGVTFWTVAATQHDEYIGDSFPE